MRIKAPLVLIIVIATYLHSFALIPEGKLAPAGFFIPDSIGEVTFRYKKVNNLILLPVTINDTIHVNLILDTGCRNVVLFGRRFMKLFNMHPDQRVPFSGLGSGHAINGRVSFENKVSIDAVLGNRIPVVVVPDPKLFSGGLTVDGIIGYDIFIKFEIELHTRRQLITFRPALTANLDEDYNLIPIRIVDSRPVLKSTLSLNGVHHAFDIMIDTGSSLGLLLKTHDRSIYTLSGDADLLGKGLNGTIEGIRLVADRLTLHDFAMAKVPIGIIQTEWSSTPSIGMDILGNYSLVLNYCKGYAGLKNASGAVAIVSKPSKVTGLLDF